MGLLLRIAACKCGMSSSMWVIGPDYRIVHVAVNDPRREAPSLESFVLDEPGITPCWRRRCRRRRAWGSRWRGRRGCPCHIKGAYPQPPSNGTGRGNVLVNVPERLVVAWV